jgi:metal-sulfur cluster biosynthetic enzyme
MSEHDSEHEINASAEGAGFGGHDAPTALGPSDHGALTREGSGNSVAREGETPQATTSGAQTAASSVDVEEVMDALANVIDPELGLDFVELGLVYGVEIDSGNVHVTYTLTTPGCPIGPQVAEQIEEFVGDVEGVKSVQSELVFTPPWSPERMSEDAKFALGF